MRASIRVGIPIATTAAELRAMASLLSAIESGAWDQAAAVFDRLRHHDARLSESMAIMLGALAGQLRIAGRERADDDAEQARLAAAAAAPVAR